MNDTKTPWRISDKPWPGDRIEKGLLVVLVCGALFGLWNLWDGYYRDRVFPKRFAVVHEGTLFRSGELSEALVEDTWREHGIEVVVNLGKDKDFRVNHRAAKQAAENLNIDRSLYNLNGDGTGRPEMYAAALQRIVEAQRDGKRTIVHCKAGLHRTGGVVAAYRMLYDGWEPIDARDEMLSFDVQNPMTIVNYLNQNLPEIAQRLVDAGVLEQVPSPMPWMPAL